MLEMVEHDERIGEHQRHVGQPERVGPRLAERLDGAHEVIAEEADGATGERRAVLDRRLLEARDVLRGERIRVAAVGERPAEHGARAKADERPAPDALALICGLEQKRGLARRQRAQLQERRDGRLAILDEAVAQRDQVVRAGKRLSLLEARLDADAGALLERRAGGARSDGHRAPAPHR